MLIAIPAHLGYAAVAGLVAGESAGLPIPGETALVTAALLGAAGHLSLPVLVGVAAVAAIAGDNVGYWIGRKAGRAALLAHRGPWRRHRTRALARGEAFFARHGVKAVALARWIPGVRVVAAVVAGATRMPPGRFLAANALGAVTWAAGTVALVAALGPVGAGVVLGAGVAVTLAGAAAGVMRAGRARLRTVSAPAGVGHDT